jgi:hypothetical protein
MPGVEISTARKKNGSGDHCLLGFEDHATAGAEILPWRQDAAAAGAKLNEPMSRGHFPRRGRKHNSSDGGNLLSIPTAKIGIGDHRAAFGFESDVTYQPAFGLHFFEIAPMDDANAFSPAPIALDRKK